MKRIISFLLIAFLLVPQLSLAATLPETRKNIDDIIEIFEEQLIKERTQATANNTQDLIDVGIHNLRILRAQINDVCYSLEEDTSYVENATLSKDIFNSCSLYADQQYAMAKEVFRASMLQDMYLKKTSLYEARLANFNDHLRTILDLLIFIRGTITKVQKGIDGTAEKTFTQ